MIDMLDYMLDYGSSDPTLRLQAERLLLLWEIERIIHDHQLNDTEIVEMITEMLEERKNLLIACETDEEMISSL